MITVVDPLITGCGNGMPAKSVMREAGILPTRTGTAQGEAIGIGTGTGNGGAGGNGGSGGVGGEGGAGGG